MADRTGIEWSDATWNPLRGCSRVSSGCQNCYAEKQAAVIIKQDRERGVPEGAGAYDGLLAKGGQWNGEIKLVPELLGQPVRWARSRRIFVNSMSDLFHESVPFPFIAAVLAVIAATPRHTYQVLTKRPQQMLAFFDWLENKCTAGAADRYAASPAGKREKRRAEMNNEYVFEPSEMICRLFEAAAPVLNAEFERNAGAVGLKRLMVACTTKWPLENLWMGVSVEDQATANQRIPPLLKVPATVRWISMEPLLGRVTLQEWVEPILHCGSCGDSYYLDEALPDPDGHPMGKDRCARCSAENCLTTTWGRDAAENGCPEHLVEEDWDYGAKLHWVVVGGESGASARPMHPDWVSTIRNQCKEAEIPFLFKQWGEWCPRSSCYHTLTSGTCASEIDPGSKRWLCVRLTDAGGNGRDLAQCNGGNDVYMQKVGHKLAGRVFMGEMYDGYPHEVRSNGT